MAEATDTNDSYTNQIKELIEKFDDVQKLLKLQLYGDIKLNSINKMHVIQESLNIQQLTKTLSNSLLDDQLSNPSVAANFIWNIIESHSSSPEAVKEGRRVLEYFCQLKIYSTIKPERYLDAIREYVEWQNETTRCFVEQFKAKPKSDQLKIIEDLWDWNLDKNEKIFFSGAARPLHLKGVTELSSITNGYYDTFPHPFKENRNALVEALKFLLRQESKLHWPKYKIFPCISSNAILDKCLQYFYFKDRQNTWFLNSSASDYIPFVSSAREIFAERFDGSRMNSPDQHNTEWILGDLEKRCSNIYDRQDNEIKPVIIILLTSKNRFGHRIDVDHIHSELTRQFPTVVTIVDACLDGCRFSQVDIAIYTRRFTATGAIGLVNREFLSKNRFLEKKLKFTTSFPVGILAQIYMNINMAHKGIAHGVEDLANSSWWSFSECPIRAQLYSTFDEPYKNQFCVQYSRDRIQYSFTEDDTGTLIMLTADYNGEELLPKLWAYLKSKGHSLDCFVMDNPYLKNPKEGVCSTTTKLSIERKFIEELREIQLKSSDYLAWTLIPDWVSSPDDISVDQLTEHFDACKAYHCCLRISVGCWGYPGKLKRFVELIDDIFRTGKLNVSDDVLGKHSP